MDYLPTDGRESGHAEHFARVGLATGTAIFRPGTRTVSVRGGAVGGDGDPAGARLPPGGRWPLVVFVVTALLMAAVGYCIGQFSTRMVAVSGLYSYTVKGSAPFPASSPAGRR